MAQIPGVNVGSAIAPFDTADNQPTHRSIYGQGGLRTVDTIADRNAIYSSRLEEGMRVYVKADQKTYVLQPGYSTPTINTDWTEESVSAIALPASGVYNPTGSIAGDAVEITCLVKYNNYIFSGGNGGEVSLFDITDPSNPVNLGIIGIIGNTVTDLKIAGNYLLACDSSGNFYVFDISTPINSTAFPEYNAGSGVYSFSSMAVIGSQVGLTDSLNSKFVILDFADPNNIYRVSELDLPTKGRSVCIQDNTFYVAHSDNSVDDGVSAISIDGTLIFSTLSIPNTTLAGICSNGRYVFCSEGDSSANNSLYVIDVYDVNNITQQATLDLTPHTLLGKANCFGDFVTLTTSTGDGLIVSVRDPLNPVLLYTFPVTNNVAATINEGILSGGYVLFGYGDDGVSYLDIFLLQDLSLAGLSVESAEVGELNVQKNINANGTISTQKGLIAGVGGVQSLGPITASRYNGMIDADSANGVVVKSIFEVQGVTPPSGSITAALAGTGSGNVNIGDHEYKVTYLTNAGESIPIATASNVVTVVNNATNGKVRLTNIPVSNDLAVISKRLYRRFNGTGEYKRLATISNSIVSYVDNIANASLTADLDDEDTSNRTTLGNTRIEKLLTLSEQGVASATNVDLPRANTMSISGNTDIEGFTSTGIPAGTPIFVYVPDATVGTLTFVHDGSPASGYAKILTKTGANIVASAGETFVFVRTGSVWRQFI